MIQTLTNLKNLILNKIRANSKNMLIFAKASPLVRLKGKGQQAESVCDEVNSSNFDMRSKILKKLETNGK